MQKIVEVKTQLPYRQHGLSKHPLYLTWRSMIHRCYSPKNKSYSYYGGRGVSVCERWLDQNIGLLNFVEDMGSKPTQQHTLDRMDTNGPYSKENCRWADKKTQARNCRLRLGNNSGYPGVNRKKTTHKWEVHITVGGKAMYLSSHELLEDAVKARKKAEKELW